MTTRTELTTARWRCLALIGVALALASCGFGDSPEVNQYSPSDEEWLLNGFTHSVSVGQFAEGSEGASTEVFALRIANETCGLSASSPATIVKLQLDSIFAGSNSYSFACPGLTLR